MDTVSYNADKVCSYEVQNDDWMKFCMKIWKNLEQDRGRGVVTRDSYQTFKWYCRFSFMLNHFIYLLVADRVFDSFQRTGTAWSEQLQHNNGRISLQNSMVGTNADVIWTKLGKTNKTLSNLAIWLLGIANVTVCRYLISVYLFIVSFIVFPITLSENHASEVKRSKTEMHKKPKAKSWNAGKAISGLPERLWSRSFYYASSQRRSPRRELRRIPQPLFCQHCIINSKLYIIAFFWSIADVMNYSTTCACI